jgi:hypothetical protein|tara:strand:+ start:416 stop:670 length:255 start_codon:yes stop_codon:yes gene_type:complete
MKELKKHTPYKTKDWYLKWISSLILIVGILFTSHNIYPLNLFISSIGLLGWTIVGFVWNDRAIMIVNAISLIIYLNGIINYYVT